MNDSGIFRSPDAPPSGIVSGVFLNVDADGGIEFSQLRPGTILEVRTKNTAYTVIPQADGGATIWGHPEYCPEPVTLKGVGASYVTGLFREGYLAPGMRLSFPIDGKRVNTSRITEITLKRKN